MNCTTDVLVRRRTPKDASDGRGRPSYGGRLFLTSSLKFTFPNLFNVVRAMDCRIRILLGLATLGLSGCLTPWNTRFPELWGRGTEYERREQQIQDPYPDSQLGPDTNIRPRDYANQRSQARRVKDGYAAALLRGQNVQYQGPPTPLPTYPQAIPQN